MIGFGFSRFAREDVDRLLSYSRHRFGLQTADRYEALLIRAFATLRSNPSAQGVRLLGDKPDLFRFHLRSLPQPKPKAVSRPRHLVIFTVTEAELTVVRVLHEKMEIERHLG